MYEIDQIGWAAGGERGYRHDEWIGEAKDATDGGTRKGFEATVCLRVEGNNCDASKSNG